MEPFFVLLVVVLVGIIVILIRANRRAIAKILDVEEQRNQAHRRIKEGKQKHHVALMALQNKLGEYKQVRNQIEHEAAGRVAEAREALAQEVSRRTACERDNEELRLQNAVLASQREAAIETLSEAFRPERNRCTKLPIYNREDAEYWATKKTKELGREMMHYKCDICPRYIVTGERIYHLANRDPARRTLAYHKGIPRSSPADDTPIDVTPTVIAQLRNKLGH